MTTKSAAERMATEHQEQLELMVERSAVSWKIDPETREIGRQGLANARAVLQATRPSFLDLAA